jgi:hypothetical protein
MKILILLMSLLAFAEIDRPGNGNRTEDLHQKETSELFEVTMIPKTGETQFFIAGKRTQIRHFENLEVKGTYQDGEGEKPFTLFRRQDHFYTKDQIKGRDVSLEIKDSESGQKEKINVRGKQ